MGDGQAVNACLRHGIDFDRAEFREGSGVLANLFSWGPAGTGLRPLWPSLNLTVACFGFAQHGGRYLRLVVRDIAYYRARSPVGVAEIGQKVVQARSGRRLGIPRRSKAL